MPAPWSPDRAIQTSWKAGQSAGLFLYRHCLCLADVSRQKGSMIRFIVFLIVAAWGPALASADTSEPQISPGACKTTIFDGVPMTVCTADLSKGTIGLFHSHRDGSLIGQPSAIEPPAGQRVVFAMNAGMFHLDREPVGLFVEDGDQRAPLVRGEGPGNFQLLPNGVFWVSGNMAGISETEAFAEADMDVDQATQSGPMLVIDGELHPALRAGSDSVFIRNGVGVSDDGGTAVFAISDAPVNFHTFARFFRDDLAVDNALYLDGKVSLLYAPNLNRTDMGLSVGPLVAFTQEVGD